MMKLAHLRELVIDSARNALKDARSKVLPRDIFGFCLYSDDSATTIVHSIGVRENGAPTKYDDDFWNPHEWGWDVLNRDSHVHLGPAQKWIEQYYDATRPADNEYDEYRDRVFRAIVGGLKELRNEGLFGHGNEQLYLIFSVSQWTEEDVFPWVAELNPPSTVNACRKWMVGRTMPPVTRTMTKPDTGALSSQEQEYLCFANRGMVQQLRELPPADIRDFVIHEALVLAAWKGNTEACSYLLECGANPSHQGYMGKTALEYAKQEGKKSVIELLPDASVEVDEFESDVRHKLNKEIEYLLCVVIPQQRAQKNA